MIRLVLTRLETDLEGTFGELTGEAIRIYSGELPWNKNERSKSCIPSGTYICKPHMSPKFGECFWILDVPNRSEILIHPANYMGDIDSGYRSDLLGCIGIGMTKGHDPTINQRTIWRSKEAVKKLIEYTEFKPFELEIINETHINMEV